MTIDRWIALGADVPNFHDIPNWVNIALLVLLPIGILEGLVILISWWKRRSNSSLKGGKVANRT